MKGLQRLKHWICQKKVERVAELEPAHKRE